MNAARPWWWIPLRQPAARVIVGGRVKVLLALRPGETVRDYTDHDGEWTPLVCPKCGTRDDVSQQVGARIPCSGGCGALMAVAVQRRLAP